MTAVAASSDPKTTSLWAELLTIAPDTLRNWCRAVRLPTKDSLDLARMLRCVVQAGKHGSSPHHFLDVSHPRTAGRLLQRAGLSDVPHDQLDVLEMLSRQMFIRERWAIAELAAQLRNQGAAIDLAKNAPEYGEYYR
jgi:hypothetical protein